MKRAVDHVHLLLAREFHEIDCISGNPDCELRVFFGMLHRVAQRVSIEYVDVHVETLRGKVRVEATDQSLICLLLCVRAWLGERGWPAPVAADSGNGYHLFYGIDLENNEESTALVKSCLASLAAKFDDDTIKIDTTVYNAARIVKAYGSMAAKGDSTNDRPHRIAHLLIKPDKLESVTVVPTELLQALAGEAPKKEIQQKQEKTGASKTKITPEKMEEFLDLYKVRRGARIEYEGGNKWQIGGKASSLALSWGFESWKDRRQSTNDP